MNLPAHGTASLDPSKASLSVKTTPGNKEQQRYRLARPTCRQAKLFQTAWRYMPAARRQHSSSATVFPTPPGGAHPCRQATNGVGTSDASPIAWRTRSCR